MMMRRFYKLLPRGLFGRALLMVGLPPVLLSLVVGVAVPDRWREDVTERFLNRLAKTLVLLRRFDVKNGDAVGEAFGFIVKRYDLKNPPPSLPALCRIPLRPEAPAALIRSTLNRQVGEPLAICAPDDNNTLWQVRLLQPPAIDVYVPGHYFINSKWHFVPVWTAASALVTVAISVLFMKNQVRPIRQLAAAADAFGRGEDLPYRPSGAEEVRRAGTAFLKMRARLRRNMRERELFSVGVGHDLRTMLTRMKLAVSLMDDDPAHRALNDDLTLTARMVDSFLDFAVHNERESLEPHAPVPLLREAVARYPSVLLQSLLPEDATLPLRVSAFQRAVYNLLDNAVRYGTRVRVLAEPYEGMLRISVLDNGPGVPEHLRAALWQPFTRGDPARTPHAAVGLGLGLALVRDIMRAHGGSAFFVDLPGEFGVALLFPMQARGVDE